MTCKNGHPAESTRVVETKTGYSLRVCSDCKRAARRVAGRAAGPVAVPPIERLLRGRTVDANGCWLSTNRPNRKGYVRVGFGRRGSDYIHRVSYTHFCGPIPTGLTIDHLCRNRGCFNPDHLEAVTLVENVLRGNSQPAIRRRLRDDRARKAEARQ